MINGVINIYKEKGFTSHDVVAKLRGICKQKKIGHTGTLDPDAEGVLMVCLGSATKLCDLLTDKRKEYRAEILLGVTTDTQDITGTTLKQCDVTVSEEEVSEAVLSFCGDILQIPPMYSALKVNGKKLYELARAGVEVERKARPITIYEIEILRMELPVVEIRVLCSKGTYIRTLCHDIGGKLGCGACMKSLTRSRVDQFTLEDALTLDAVEKCRDEGKLMEHIIPVEDIFAQLAKVTVLKEYEKLIDNGNKFYKHQSFAQAEKEIEDAEEVRVYNEAGVFYGVYCYDQAEKCYTPVKMFLSR